MIMEMKKSVLTDEKYVSCTTPEPFETECTCFGTAYAYQAVIYDS